MPIGPELVEACRRGDQRAFEEVVRATSRPLYTLIYRLVGNHDDAADALQETYLRAWRGLRGFRGDADLGTWLHRVATNVALRHLKKRARTPQPVEEDALEPPEPAPDAAEARLDADVLEQALARLAAPQRAVVVLKDVYRWSIEEIARTAGMTEGAVKVRLFRARRRLADYLTESGAFGPTGSTVVPMKRKKRSR